MTTLPVAASAEAATSPAPGSSGRILGLDLARGIAVLGMITAHVAYTSDDLTEVAGWLGFTHGRSSILFALLAGVSLGILTGRAQPYVGVAGLQARIRVFTRSALLLVMGGVLNAFGTPVAIILAFYAVWFVAALPFVRWSAKRLIIGGAIWAVVGAVAATYLTDVLWVLGLNSSEGANGLLLDTLLGIYPGLMWLGFVLVGLGISKLDLHQPVVTRQLAAVGALTAIIGYVVGWLGQQHAAGPIDDTWNSAGWGDGFYWTDVWSLFDTYPHSATPFEALGSGGVAVAILGLCLSAPVWLQRLLTPISSVGALSLTAYSGHIIALAVAPDFFFGDYGLSSSQTPYLVMIGTVVVFCTLWVRFFGRGPLEAIVRATTLKAARIDTAQPVAGQA